MTLLTALSSRVRSQPLLTYYHPEHDERIEFSAASFENWVTKTANLLEDLGITEGDEVELQLADTHPGHWVTLIWPLACWRNGVGIGHGPNLPLIVGPEATPIPGREVIGCSLHPLALGLGDIPGVVDFTAEALSQPDIYVGIADPHPQAESHAEPISDRVLCRATPNTFAEAIAGVLLGGGSAVVVAGTVSDEKLRQIAQAERARLLNS